jgi:hypothetical protein
VIDVRRCSFMPQAAMMPSTNGQASVLVEIAEDIESRDAARVARRLGGFIANDEEIREAIQTALAESTDMTAGWMALRAVAVALTKGASHGTQIE